MDLIHYLSYESSLNESSFLICSCDVNHFIFANIAGVIAALPLDLVPQDIEIKHINDIDCLIVKCKRDNFLEVSQGYINPDFQLNSDHMAIHLQIVSQYNPSSFQTPQCKRR